MTSGTYERTPEIRERNRRNAVPPYGCDEGCTCRRHRVQIGRPGKKCPPDCTCGRHRRTVEHNRRIGTSVRTSYELNERARR